uniref:Putative low-density lipoprotein receptor n=1 Tax=Ixodes ricinus TaxID=34613 RepID=A0A6B0VG21_IXORI
MASSGVIVVLALAAVLTHGVRLSFVRCPNGSACPDGSTCCLRSSGLYGCCPYPFAVCCSDHQHCCPEGYHCNLSNGSCVQISTSVKEIQTLLTAMVLSPQPSVNYKAIETVQCPDRKYCQDGQTCCLLSEGRYGCCPYPHAVCCSDHASCCPEGYQCKVSAHTCIAGNSTVPMLEKVSTIDDSPPENPAPVETVQCPDKHYCQDGQTCCLLSEGRYGCCPYPHAVCCSDHASCCPEGYQCKVSTHTCIAGNSTVPMLKKVSTIADSPPENPTPVQLVPCPDGTSCPSDMVCCLAFPGVYGCCLGADSVCCPLRGYCCRHGYKCGPDDNCVTDNTTLPAIKKIIVPGIELRPLTAPVTDHRCPDGAECNDDQTCCKLTDQSYGCCPYKDAVCCPDLVHCCPNGYACDTKDGKCVKKHNQTTVPLRRLLLRSSLGSVKVRLTDHKCPDGAECNDDQTCCELADQSYGCCPYRDAVCCSDRAHCCPNGYKCDTKERKCVKSHRNRTTVSRRRLSLRSSLRSVEVRLLDNTCEDGHVCPGETTCCVTPSGTYHCCPFAFGVCCSDLRHCCPQGYTCDVSTQTCKEGGLYPFLRDLPMLPKFPSSSNRP